MALALPLARHGLNRQGGRGEATITGLRQPVEILRDRWGISHIFAKSEHDLFLGRLQLPCAIGSFRLELWRRQATGTLAEIEGPRALTADFGARLLRYRGEIRHELDHYHPRI